jgi:hypothetical protein
MDTGWVLYGVLLVVGALGLRPIAIVVLAIVAGVGVSLVGSSRDPARTSRTA